MSNTITYTTTMAGLWKEDAFWGFFDPLSPKTAKRILGDSLVSCGEVRFIISAESYAENLKAHVPMKRLRENFKADFLTPIGDSTYPPINCVLRANEPDAITTVFGYSSDDGLITGLCELFPDREIHCSWFVDGSGDYGEDTFLNHKRIKQSRGNLQEDLALAEGLPESEIVR